MNEDFSGITTKTLRHLVSKAENRFPEIRLMCIGYTHDVKHGYILWFNTPDGSSHMVTWSHADEEKLQ